VSTALGDLAKDDPGLRDALAQALESLRDRELGEILDVIAATACRLLPCRLAVVTVLAPDGHVEHLVRRGGEGAAPECVGDLPAGQLLEVPIVLRGQPAGVLSLAGSLDGGPFGDLEQRIAAVFAAAVGAEVERSRTAEQNRRRERWYTRGSQLARDLAISRHLDPLQVVTDQVAEIADASRAAFLRSDGDGTRIGIAALRGERRIWDAALTGDGELDCSAVMASARPVRGEVDGCSVLLVPLVSTHGPLGVLALGRGPDASPFTVAEGGAAMMLAGQVALALELADVQAHRDQLRLLEERDRIARDLHDHVIQRLFAIGMSLQHAGLQLPGDTAGVLRESVDEIDDAIRQIRTTIYRLTGAITAERLSIRTRAEQLVDDLEPLLGFRPVITASGPVDLAVEDADLVDDCLAVLREALTNVARHAQASSVRVDVVLDGQRLTLQVADDGRGLGDSQRRSGLANLRARAARHGGDLLIDSAPGRGTRLVWSIPARDVLRAPDAAD
jgi:signal transduction histidine kinase